MEAVSTDIKHEPKSPPDAVCGPAIGLNLTGGGVGGADAMAGGGAFGEPGGVACNGHTPRYGGVLAAGATADLCPCPGVVAPTLMDDTDQPADGQPLSKRLHFADSNGWSP